MATTTGSEMYQAIQRQPDDLRRLLTEGWDPATQAAELIASSERIFLAGIGTSYHAAMVGSWLFRAAGKDARAVMSSDLAHYPEQFGIREGDAVVVMAHTGVKQLSTQSMQYAASVGATVLSVGSRTAEHPGSALILRTVEREKSAAYTTSHLGAMTVLAQVATAISEQAGDAGDGLRESLVRLPDQVAAILEREDEIALVAELARSKRIYATAAGPNEATALELTIKAREAAYAWVDALALEQFLHGPAVAVTAGDIAILVHVPGAASVRTQEVATVLAAMGTDLWIVGEPVAALPDAPVFALPGLAAMPEVLTPLLTVIPMQLLAYHLAAVKGTNPDTFRRDDPTYKDAFGLITL